MENEVAATALATNALVMALIQRLVLTSALSAEDYREIFIQALTMVETSQGGAPHVQDIHEIARRLLEKGLGSQT